VLASCSTSSDNIETYKPSISETTVPDSIITDTTPTIESETKPNEPKQDPLLAWGLGITESEYVLSGERSYDWYMCQRNTGYASSVNCGPAVAAMAAKWSDESFSKTVEDLRNTD
jgi:hypothetical protein